MGNIVTLNYFKHKPNKSFVLTTTMKGTYPIHLLDNDRERLDTETADNHGGWYHDHFFDCSDIYMGTHHFRADDISSGFGPL